jgi:hypothetical protein
MTGTSYANLSQLEDTVVLHGCRHTLSRIYLIFVHPNLELPFSQNQHSEIVTHTFVVLDALDGDKRKASPTSHSTYTKDSSSNDLMYVRQLFCMGINQVKG